MKGSAFAGTDLPSTCTSCHIPADSRKQLASNAPEDGFRFRDTDCAGCHLDIVERPRQARPLSPHAITAMMDKRTYLNARPLTFTVQRFNGNQVERYDPSGLLRFLKAPVPRLPASGNSMFPLSQSQLAQVAAHISNSVSEMAPSNRDELTKADHAKGQVLFRTQGCATCHETGAGPKLRIGYQLFSWDFFRAKVRGEISREVSSKMPAFDLKNQDIRDLFAYINRSDEGIASPPQPATADGALLLRLKLYRAVRDNVLATSCRHCHSSSAKASKAIAAVFDRRASSGFALARGLDGKIEATESSHRLFEPGPGCRPSTLVTMLRERRDEWLGKDDPKVTGMPLTLAPLDEHIIDQAHLWTSLGCPSPRGDLCKPCS